MGLMSCASRRLHQADWGKPGTASFSKGSESRLNQFRYVSGIALLGTLASRIWSYRVLNIFV